MAMTLRKVLYLKRVLQSAADLKEPSDVFWNDLAPRPEFLTMGKLATDSRLVSIVEGAARKVLGGEPRASMLILIRIARYRFWHGTCDLGGYPAQVIYFDDIDCGLLTVVKNPVIGEILYMRFSALTLDSDNKAWPVNLRHRPRA